MGRPKGRPRRGGDLVRTTVTLDAAPGAALARLAAELGMTEATLIRHAVSEFLVSQDQPTETAKRIRNLFPLLKRFKNPYQDVLSSWRVNRIGTQLKGISDFNRLELKVEPPERYVLNVLSEILGLLGKNDEMLAMTNLDFWQSVGAANPAQNLDIVSNSAGTYLDEQVKAVKDGLRLFRIFLITQADENAATFRRHFQFLDDIGEEHSQHVRVNYVAFPDRIALSNAIHQMGHFALIRRIAPTSTTFPAVEDAGSMLFRPLHASRGVDRLEYEFSGSDRVPDNINYYFGQFKQTIKKSRPIVELRH